MKKYLWVLVVALVLVWGRPAHAFGVEDITGTGAKIVAVSGTVLVWADKALHWSWRVLHNQIVHPIVKVGTLGIVDLESTDQ